MSDEGSPNRYFDWVRFKGLLQRSRLADPTRWLPVLFLLISVLDLARHYPETIGIDTRIYYRAAEAYVDGGDPWSAYASGTGDNEYHFAALPPTVLVFVPLTLLPERFAVWVVLWISVLSAYYIVRRLRLPLWWMLFPPLVQGIYAANPQVPLLAMLISGVSALAAVAPMLKIYAFAPLVGNRWITAIAIATGYLALSIVVAPSLWASYLDRAGDIAARLVVEAKGGYSATGTEPLLVAAALLGLGLLATVDFPAAGWLASPALVPASQFHLSTMAMPVLAARPAIIFTVAMALPVKELPTAAIAIYGCWRFYSSVRSRRNAGRHVEVGPND
jgi:hypothetical protein